MLKETGVTTTADFGASTTKEYPPLTTEFYLSPAPTGHKGTSTINESPPPTTELTRPTETSTIYEGPSPTRDDSQIMKPREMVAWILVVLLAILFIGLVTLNITIIFIYKQRQIRDNEAQASAYEMAGNPCYETCEVKQTTELETNIYEAVGTERVYV